MYDYDYGYENTLSLGELLEPEKYFRPMRKVIEVGDDGTREHRLAAQLRSEVQYHEEAIAFANRAIAVYAPEGDKTDVGALSKEDRDVLTQAYATRRAALAKLKVVQEQLAGLVHAAPPAEDFADHPEVAKAAEARYLAKCETAAAIRGDLGRLSHSEQQRIRTNDIKTEMVLGEVLARARAQG